MTQAAVAAVDEEEAPHSEAVWDLSDLYAGPDDPALVADLDWARQEAAAFNAAYAGKLALLPGSALGEAIARFEALIDRMHRVLSFTQLANLGMKAKG